MERSNNSGIHKTCGGWLILISGNNGQELQLKRLMKRDITSKDNQTGAQFRFPITNIVGKGLDETLQNKCTLHFLNVTLQKMVMLQ